MKLVTRFQTVFRRQQTQAIMQQTLIRHQMSSCVAATNQRLDVQRNTDAKHWSFLSLAAQTLQFDGKQPVNDNSVEQFMKTKYDLHQHESFDGHKHEEKLSLAHKSNTLLTLFEDLSTQRIDNVLQNKILSKGDSLQQEHCNIDQWLLFNYHDIDMSTGYDANGIIICGLSTECNQAYEIGPIILAKTKENYQ